MYSVRLLYGVHLGGLPPRRILLQEDIVDTYGRVNLGSLVALLDRHRLTVLYDTNRNPTFLSDICIGVAIRGEDLDGFKIFDPRKIASLCSDPSQLAERLGKIGIEAKPRDFALCAMTFEQVL